MCCNTSDPIMIIVLLHTHHSHYTYYHHVYQHYHNTTIYHCGICEWVACLHLCFLFVMYDMDHVVLLSITIQLCDASSTDHAIMKHQITTNIAITLPSTQYLIFSYNSHINTSGDAWINII